jgi:hypothetical protein
MPAIRAARLASQNSGFGDILSLTGNAEQIRILP